MKKIRILFLFGGLFIWFSSNIFAQEDYTALNLFVKFGSDTRMNAHYEFPLDNNFTVSPSVSLPFNFNWIALGGRIDYYFDSITNLPEPWDVWAGIDTSIIINGDDDFTLNAHAGVEYKFNKTFGLILEFGGGTASFGGIGVGIHL